MINVAILELNESFLRLSIYKTNNGKYKIIEEKRQSLKLGEEIVSEELLRPKTRADILEMLRIYRKICESFKVENIVAVASNLQQHRHKLCHFERR